MNKRLIIGTIAIAVVWFVLEFAIHGHLLKPLYEQTKQLWRPEADMKMGFYLLALLVLSATFVAVYEKLVTMKSMQNALLYSGLVGIGWGVGFGLGNYSWMPIPLALGVYWMLAIIVEALIAGVVLAYTVKD
ncbi:MAG: hypothetical protein O2912_04275 [Proteobacteria bacterium]|nr:hypothetical protein [Pseudomonadota bacterium]